MRQQDMEEAERALVVIVDNLDAAHEVLQAAHSRLVKLDPWTAGYLADTTGRLIGMADTLLREIQEAQENG